MSDSVGSVRMSARGQLMTPAAVNPSSPIVVDAQNSPSPFAQRLEVTIPGVNKLGIMREKTICNVGYT